MDRAATLARDSENGQKRPGMVRGGSKTAKNGPKRVQNDPKRPKWPKRPNDQKIQILFSCSHRTEELCRGRRRSRWALSIFGGPYPYRAAISMNYGVWLSFDAGCTIPPPAPAPSVAKINEKIIIKIKNENEK